MEYTRRVEVVRLPDAESGGAVRAAKHELGERDLRRRRRRTGYRHRHHEYPRLRIQRLGAAAHVPAGRLADVQERVYILNGCVRRAGDYHGDCGVHV